MPAKREPIWFHQRIVSPHMAGLAKAVAAQGRRVVYVVERTMSEDRAAQGWSIPDLGEATLRLAPDAAAVKPLVSEASPESIHICQGIRSNGLVGLIQRELASRRLRQWVVMETIDDDGPIGALKRLEYWRLFKLWRKRLQGVLAIGWETSRWVIARGWPEHLVFPFAYFLPNHTPAQLSLLKQGGVFRVLFVGQFIERKRLDLLIDAVAAVNGRYIELAVAGSGPLEGTWHAHAESKLGPNKVIWLGRLPLSEIPTQMVAADCLVLPSRYDGWGVVVSEALMVGTPAICSDRCGSAAVVRASGYGGVFPSGDVAALTKLLEDVVAHGRQRLEQRRALSQWAQCLGAVAGARYLEAILEHQRVPGERPLPPWAKRFA